MRRLVAVVGSCSIFRSNVRECTVTASGKGHLRTLPLAKLKKYAKDYNIDVTNVLERDELIDRLIALRVSCFEYWD